MKIKGILLAVFSLIGVSAFAQGIEYDDMYFNAEDRANLKAKQAMEVAYNTPDKTKQLDRFNESENINPTDTYSARNVNPEYTSRAHTQTAQELEEEYFVNNYQYNRTQLNNWNNDFDNWYSNPWYRPNYYGAGINNWNSPYYGYNSWNSPWYDPYWANNGWSSSFSFHYGRSWNYGWGGHYNYWNRPYYGWDPYGMAYSGYGLGYGGGYWNNYMYPGTIIVVNNERNNRGVVYGKRPTRGSSIVSDRNSVRSRSNATNDVRTDNSAGRNTSGRVSTQSQKQQDYYSRYNRVRSNTNSTYDSRSNTEYNRARSWDNSSWNSSNSNSSRTSTPSYSPSRSSSGAGTRTNSSSSGSRRGRD